MNGWALFAAAAVAVVFLPLAVLGLAAVANSDAEPPAVPERDRAGESGGAA